MFLSDIDLKDNISKGIIKVEPHPSQNDYRQCGIRVKLSDRIFELKEVPDEVIDLRRSKAGLDSNVLKDKFYKEISLSKLPDKRYILEPGKMVLGSTVQKIKLPDYMVSYLDGRSTLARFGITNNITASVIDNMHTSEPTHITLEIKNCGAFRFALYEDMDVGMLLFSNLSSRSCIPPSGRYKDMDILPNPH
jgi:dCTP deaminase